MTAEAIAMNRSAVALAADSAVTISGRRGHKTFESANKLFELIRGSNIGVMVYSNSVINGVPWETVIKTFRRDHSTFQASHVDDYFDVFMRYIADHRELMAPTDEWRAVRQIVHWYAGRVFRSLDRAATDLIEDGVLIEERVQRAIDAICDRCAADLDQLTDVESAGADPLTPLRRAFGECAVDEVTIMFEKLPITAQQRERIAHLALVAVTKQLTTPMDTGLVFAGFGTRDYFPRQISTRIAARLCGSVYRHEHVCTAVTQDEPGHLQTFAQDEPARGWIDGISNQVRTEIEGHWRTWLGRLPDLVGDRLADVIGLAEDQARVASKAVHELAGSQLEAFLRDMQRYENRFFREPMLSSVSMLPKDELALLAESLVNITSLKQRMSIFEMNTVGGAIDVALISPGDGFVWLNRKHYFEGKLNPAWHLSHGATIRGDRGAEV